MFVELPGDEGFNFEDLKVSEIRGASDLGVYLHEYPENKRQGRLILRVVGFHDEKAPQRNCGSSIDECAQFKRKEDLFI